ncbi:hypothetical protein ABW20_dc0102333 [Dactylellina cionopaga]|nr:hypothetical protein ABW20_dc0102333 [Dactylellina cionopaga]
MVCASIPALKPFIVRYLGRYFSKWASGNGYYNRSGPGDSAGIQLSNARRGTNNNSQAKKNSLFYKGSVVTTTEITAAHSDENRLFENDPNDATFIDVELASQTSLQEQDNRRIFDKNELRIMKTSNVIVDSRRISAETTGR